jgi:urease accessory protein
LRALLPLAAALILAIATPAAAHTITPGTSGFTDGLTHPFGLPAHIMVMLGAGLLVGQRDIADWRAPLYGFVAGFVLGLAGGPLLTTAPLAQAAAVFLLSAALVFGGLIVWARPLPTLGVAPIMAIAGFVLGFDSAPDGTLQQTLAALAGTGFAVVFTLLNLAMLANYARANAARHGWQMIGVRIVGSWIAAAAIMVLTLELRPA